MPLERSFILIIEPHKMKNLKYPLFLLTAILTLACGTVSKRTSDKSAVGFKVEHKGALKNMMHKGDIAAKANLKDLENSEHVYALGALENLKGEIQIFDGHPYNTMVVDSVLAFDNSFNKKATLLVSASVHKWKSISIPAEVVTREQLESYIEEAARKNQLPTDEPFPFLLEGTAKSFDWHVINWKDGDTEHSHEKHINSGLHGTIKNRPVEMLGFYSNSHHAIFTHHTTNMHIHVKTADNKIAGHVDDVTLGAGMTLKLPDMKANG